MERERGQTKDSTVELVEQIRLLREEIHFIRGSLNQSFRDQIGQAVNSFGRGRAVQDFQKAVFMPHGNDDHDRLMLELIDHPFPVEQTTIFCRPTIQSHPVRILEKLNASENKIQRAINCVAAYKSGRMKYTEIISKQKLWALLNYSEKDGFYRYRCTDITAEDVESHLDYLLDLVDSDNGYSLVLSEVSVPLFFATFEVNQPQTVECWTVLTADQVKAEYYQPSSFVIRDSSFLRGLKNSVLKLVWRDSSTITEPRDVVAEILKIKQYLRDNGPFQVERLQPS